MNETVIEIIKKMSPYGRNAKLIDDGSHRRYIASIYYDGAFIINGRAGERRYIDYTMKEAVRDYNRLCKA